jgi:hypothetical protein
MGMNTTRKMLTALILAALLVTGKAGTPVVSAVVVAASVKGTKTEASHV